MNRTLFDRRFSIWFRAPALVFGIAILLLGLLVAADALFGLRTPFGEVHGSPLLASLACLMIAALWIFVWFGRLRISYETERQELVVSTKGYLRWHKRRVSVADASGFIVRNVRGAISSRRWEVWVEYKDGHSEWVADVPWDIGTLVEALPGTTRLPVKRVQT